MMLGQMVTAGAPQGTNQRGSTSSQYDLLARLAAGGMAEIFLARANSLAGFERYVVLKRIRPERGDDARWVSMFLDEARLAAQLQHPNIAQVFDLGQIGQDYFYTMEYVHGEDVLDVLARTVDRKQPMPAQISLAIIAGAAAGLAHAHERCAPDGRPLGIVHRDISPSNLMVSYEGTVKLVDFGVAKARFRSTETQAGTIMGKVAYLSPEQCTTGEIDHRSDIFSLGIVLYEMLTAKRLFKRETDYETLRAVANDVPLAPSVLAPNLPRGLDAVVLKALAKNPDERYSSSHEMLDALEHVAEGVGMSITPNVLRRYMRDLFGTREEPWRELERAAIPLMADSEIELVEDESHPRTLQGLPLDAVADAVPMLDGKTGMIDLDALFGRQLSRDSVSIAPQQQPFVIPTGSIVRVPLPVPNARPPTDTSHARVATGSGDGVPYSLAPRVTADTAAVRTPPPRSLATVLITTVGALAVATILYMLVFHHGTPVPASLSGSNAGPSPIVTHIDESTKPTSATQLLARPPAPPVTAPPLSGKPEPGKPEPGKPEPAKPKPVSDPKLAKPSDPAPTKKAAQPCSDPLDCQY